MQRRSILKGIAGILAAPFVAKAVVPKVEEKSEKLDPFGTEICNVPKAVESRICQRYWIGQDEPEWYEQMNWREVPLDGPHSQLAIIHDNY